MNEIKVENIKVGGAFSEDAYIFNNMIFMPKKTHVKDFYINALKEWKIESVFCDGVFISSDKNTASDETETVAETEKPATNVQNEKQQTPPAANSTTIDTKNNELKAVYSDWVKKVMLLSESIIQTKNLDKTTLNNMINEMENVVWKKSDAIQLIMGSNIPTISRIFRQSVDCALYALMMARRMNMDVLMKNNVVSGALFHDIGMLKVPSEILRKEQPLTDEDRKRIKVHTVLGFTFLKDAKFTPITASAALQHHERIDGSGYPYGQKADKITNTGKLISILDTYSASISAKKIGNQIHAKEAVNYLLQLSGTAFDSQMVKEFVKTISFYPLGCIVILSDGTMAKVIGNSGIAMRPIVQATINGEEKQINLCEHSDLYIKATYVPDTSK